ncbi:hypothetical protein HZS_6151 [Henneguya salminicola]|nr:hypothetical protein HZS_6151 [Henneguya salminicola]
MSNKRISFYIPDGKSFYEENIPTKISNVSKSLMYLYGVLFALKNDDKSTPTNESITKNIPEQDMNNLVENKNSDDDYIISYDEIQNRQHKFRDRLFHYIKCNDHKDYDFSYNMETSLIQFSNKLIDPRFETRLQNDFSCKGKIIVNKIEKEHQPIIEYDTSDFFKNINKKLNKSIPTQIIEPIVPQITLPETPTLQFSDDSLTIESEKESYNSPPNEELKEGDALELLTNTEEQVPIEISEVSINKETEEIYKFAHPIKLDECIPQQQDDEIYFYIFNAPIKTIIFISTIS